MKSILLNGTLIWEALQAEQGCDFDVLWEVLQSSEIQGYITQTDLDALYCRLAKEQDVAIAFNLVTRLQRILKIYAPEQPIDLHVAPSPTAVQTLEESPPLSIHAFLERYSLDLIYEDELVEDTSIAKWYRRWRQTGFDPLWLFPIVITLALQSLPIFQQFIAQITSPKDKSPEGEGDRFAQTPNSHIPLDSQSIDRPSQPLAPSSSQTSSADIPSAMILASQPDPKLGDRVPSNSLLPSFSSGKTERPPVFTEPVRNTPQRNLGNLAPQVSRSQPSFQPPTLLNTPSPTRSETPLLIVAALQLPVPEIVAAPPNPSVPGTPTTGGAKPPIGKGAPDKGDGNPANPGGGAITSITRGAEDDVITAGRGVNFIDAGDGKNQVYAGETTNAIILAGNGDDLIFGGNGNQDIHPGTGNDTLYLGRGRNLLTLTRGEGWVTVFGFDRNDRIVETSGIARSEFQFSFDGNDTWVMAGGDRLARVVNARVSERINWRGFGN